ncbi:helix-turn-helix domain-containing protein [Luteimonas sp. XNQY3]|nr:helix-turn-helix transcriptional regulator [Luteimonas sp. XNQY3]MCD9006766.1 helix-turn-helix domain-containing protein [Luteimonas sp. XNQY3]
MRTPYTLRLGQSLRRIRQQRGLTQAQVATLAGLTREKLVQIEQGRDSVALRAYVAAAEALGAELTIRPAQRPTLDEVRTLLADD